MNDILVLKSILKLFTAVYSYESKYPSIISLTSLSPRRSHRRSHRIHTVLSESRNVFFLMSQVGSFPWISG